MADRNGYIGRAPGDSTVIIARQIYAPTGIQTDFTFDSTYTPGYLDVYLNGVRLVYPTDYSASDGSTVGLTTNAISGDTLELVAYKAFNVGNVETAGGNCSVGGNISVGGTLTYEDVTNIDSVGIVTAGGGLYVGRTSAAGIGITATTKGHIIAAGIVTATRFDDAAGNINRFYGVGIHSAGDLVGYGITQLNFIGAGNTFAYNAVTNNVDVSIAGGSGGGGAVLDITACLFV